MTEGFIGTSQKFQQSTTPFLCHLVLGTYPSVRQGKGKSAKMVAWCDRCDRSFPHGQALQQHLLNAYVHNYCSRCERDFPSGTALQQHKNMSSSHWICGQCRADCFSADDLDDHIEEYHWHCSRCNVFVESGDMLQEHYVQSSNHHYCRPCKREFQSANNLKAVCHQTSFIMDIPKLNDLFFD